MLEEAIAALGEAAENERSIRFGHEVAGELYRALVAAQEAKAAALADPEPEPEHVHGWQALGYHRPEAETLVVEVCACGAVREVVAGVES